MDEYALLGAGAAVATGIAGWLIGRRAPRPVDALVEEAAPAAPLKIEQHSGLPYEADGRQFHPRRDHKHEYTVMVGDGWGWRCGVVTDGIECGRPKEGRRGV